MSDFSIQGNSFNTVNITKIPTGKTELFKEEALRDGADNVFFELNNGDEFVATGIDNLITKPIKEGTKVNFNGQEGVISFVDNSTNTDDEVSIIKAEIGGLSTGGHIATGLIAGAAGGITYANTHNTKLSLTVGGIFAAAGEGLNALFSLTNNAQVLRADPDVNALKTLSRANPSELKQLEQSRIYEKLLNAESGYSETAKEAFNMIQETLRPNEDFTQAAKTYINILRNESGRSLDSQDAYRTIDSRLRPDETREEVANTYISILHAENGYSANALADFRLIDSRLQSGDSREFASKTFINLLRAESYSSTDARRAYKLSVSGSAEDCNK